MNEIEFLKDRIEYLEVELDLCRKKCGNLSDRIVADNRYIENLEDTNKALSEMFERRYERESK